MNWIKRARIYIRRNPLKSLLLLLIVFILGNVSAGAFSILQGSYQVEQMIKDRLPVAMAIDVDPAQTEAALKADPDFWTKGDFELIQLEDLERVAQSKYIAKYDIRLEMNVGSEYYQEWLDPFYQVNQSQPDDPNQPYRMYKLYGTSYPGVLEIEQGIWQLVEGRTFTQEEIDSGQSVGLITKNLADLNGLKIGDTMHVAAYQFAGQIISSDIIPQVVDQTDVPLRIIGIYQPQNPAKLPRGPIKAVVNGEAARLEFADEEGFHNDPTKQMQENRLIAPTALVSDVFLSDMEKSLARSDRTISPEIRQSLLTVPYTSMFFLKDPDDATAFIADMSPVLPKYYKFYQNNNNFTEIAGPVTQATDLANRVMLAAALASGLIISLVVMLFLRDRRYELGIYRSLGKPKSKVISQVVLEVLMVAILAIGLSLITGQLIAQALSDTMVSDQLDSIEYVAQLDEDYYLANYYFGDFSGFLAVEDITTNYRIEFTPRYIVLFVLIGLSTIFASAVGPMVYLLNLNPRKILT